MLTAPSIRLTPVTATEQNEISVELSQLITYAQEQGDTRLRLTGGKTLDVKETTERIDGLARQASAFH